MLTAYFDRRGWPLPPPLSGFRMLGKEARGYAKAGYETAFVKAVIDTVQPGWTCVDVGAHQGFYSILFTSIVGQHGSVISIEAHPTNAEMIRRNIALNKALLPSARLIVECFAVTDGATRAVSLFGGRDQGTFKWNIIGHDVTDRSTASVLEIPARSLDQYFALDERIDFVKMDIEGAGTYALPGMRRILRKTRPTLLIEFHDDNEWAAREELFAAGYQLYAVEPQGRRAISFDQTQRVYHCLAIPQKQS